MSVVQLCQLPAPSNPHLTADVHHLWVVVHSHAILDTPGALGRDDGSSSEHANGTTVVSRSGGVTGTLLVIWKTSLSMTVTGQLCMSIGSCPSPPK